MAIYKTYKLLVTSPQDNNNEPLPTLRMEKYKNRMASFINLTGPNIPTIIIKTENFKSDSKRKWVLEK